MNPEINALKKRIEKEKDEDFKKHRNRNKTSPTQSFIPNNTRCVYCGVLLNDKNATIDHVIPLSRGGTNTKGNKVYACVKCNSSKADMLLSEWYAKKFGVNLKKVNRKEKSDDHFEWDINPKEKSG